MAALKLFGQESRFNEKTTWPLDIGEDAEEFDRLITPDERLHIATACQWEYQTQSVFGFQ
jgi:hypothetical protein